MDTIPALEPLARRLLALLGKITGLESTYFTVIDWEQDEQLIVFSRNRGELDIAEGLRIEWCDTLCRRALDGGPARTSDVAAIYPDTGAARDLGIATYVTVPVHDTSGQVLGTVCGASTKSIEVSDEAFEVMGVVAEMIAVRLANARLMDELVNANALLEQMAFADGLTGVGNRHALERALAPDVAGSTNSVISVDLDSFKAINDAHGHQAGDDVLCAVADQLGALVRAGDTVARTGGDEFVVVLADTAADTARSIAERIRSDVAAAPIPTRAGPIAVTVSVGVATDVGPNTDSVMERADAALYAAKAAGRDQVASI